MYRRIFVTLTLGFQLCAQENTDSQAVMLQIVQRLDALERQNRELLDEVHALKKLERIAERLAKRVAGS